MRSRMLRSKAMMPMFRQPFLCFSSVFGFWPQRLCNYENSYFSLIMPILSFVDEFCTVCMLCMLPLSMQCSVTYSSMSKSSW